MSPCAGCHAGCCRSFAIPVTGADLLRIETDLGLGFAEVACRWEDRDGSIACGVMPHFFFQDEPRTPFAICLRHESSSIFQKTTKCRFLVETPRTDASPLGTASCGIYDSRPLPCRVYPTRLGASGLLAELHQVPAHGRPDEPAETAYKMCARPWELAEIDPISSVQNLIVLQFEIDFFSQVAAVWNRARLEFELFPAFLFEIYQNRVVLEDALQKVAQPPSTIRGDFTGRRSAA